MELGCARIFFEGVAEALSAGFIGTDRKEGEVFVVCPVIELIFKAEGFEGAVFVG